MSLVESLVPPRLSQSVHRDECTLCFDNQVCMRVLGLEAVPESLNLQLIMTALVDRMDR